MRSAIGFPELVVIVLLALLYVVPVWRIVTRMGHPGPVALLAMVPGLNVLLVWYLAFADWPAFRRRL